MLGTLGQACSLRVFNPPFEATTSARIHHDRSRREPPPFIIARKEIVDGLRDVRSVISSLFYVLMGPMVVSFVAFAIGKRPAPAK